jgi:hypothetical protein
MEKKQSTKLVDKPDQKINQGNETKDETKNDPKTKKHRYWEPLIPRSDGKDRLEIW